MVELHWQLADIGIGAWFNRIFRLAVACILVSVVLSIPVVLFYVLLIGGLLAHK